MVHQILFGKSTTEDLKKIDRQIFLDVFEGVPKVQILKKEIKSGVDIISALVSIGNFLSSKGEARRAIRENSISVNKNKVDENYYLTEKDLIDNRYILMQKGKKNYYIVEVTWFYKTIKLHPRISELSILPIISKEPSEFTFPISSVSIKLHE